MLPMPLQFVIAMIASAINDRIQRGWRTSRGLIAGPAGPLGERDPAEPPAIHTGASTAGCGSGKGPDRRGAAGVLPHRLAGYDSRLVPRTWRAQVRQLQGEAPRTAAEAG